MKLESILQTDRGRLELFRIGVEHRHYYFGKPVQRRQITRQLLSSLARKGYNGEAVNSEWEDVEGTVTNFQWDWYEYQIKADVECSVQVPRPAEHIIVHTTVTPTQAAIREMKHKQEWWEA
jgi:hypothetical protein